jgi:hypothetical protein
MTPAPRDEHELYEIATSNKVRIDTAEREINRLRESVHDLRSEFAALRYLGNQVKEVSGAMHELSGKLDLISRRALERPTARGWSAFAAVISAGVAIVALILALRR